jgi:hypothetical protein
MGHHSTGYSQPLMQGIAARLNLNDTMLRARYLFGKRVTITGR